MRKRTTEDFVSEAKMVHGDLYDYSDTTYVNTKTKVKILCAEHGMFEQLPYNHLYGMGCVLCGLKQAGQYHKKSTESFIAEAKAIHGDAYDYSLTHYGGARNKVTIICPKHGPFDQLASSHIRAKGKKGEACERCSYESRGAKARLSLESFLQRAVEMHHGFYDYSLAKSQFVDASTKVMIVCPEHGPFAQTPIGHLSGRGCSGCRGIKLADSFRKSTETFISDARKVHGEKYDYSEVEYDGAFEAVRILCPLDGAFIQSPSSHLSGIGCPRCSRRKQGAPRNLTRALRGEFDAPKLAFVYIATFTLPCTDVVLFKIGSGTGGRMKSVINEIRRVGGRERSIEQFQFESTGEAIVFEHLAHEQVRGYQFIVPVEYKFRGHSEVFTKAPVLNELERHPILVQFRAGERVNSRSRDERE